VKYNVKWELIKHCFPRGESAVEKALNRRAYRSLNAEITASLGEFTTKPVAV
jgi:hypothetical protein